MPTSRRERPKASNLRVMWYCWSNTKFSRPENMEWSPWLWQTELICFCYVWSWRISKPLSLAKRIFNALENFCDAAGRVQRAHFCCDFFTVLRRSSAVNLVELCQIKLELAVRFRKEFKGLLSVNEIESSGLWNCRAIATDILRIVGYLDNSTETSMTDMYKGTVDEILHTCSLAVQFLFFLDTPLTNIQLLGSLPSEGDFSKINVQLVNLTCMGNMIQEAVIAFNMSDGLRSLSPVHDLLASLEDLMDTWGPGHFVTLALDTSENGIYAINIGGVNITRAENESEKFHWSPVLRSDDISTRPFSRRTKILIGTFIRSIRIATRLIRNDGTVPLSI